MDSDTPQQAEMEAAIEAVLYASVEPVPRKRLLDLFSDSDQEEVETALEAVLARHRSPTGSGVGIMLDEAGGGLRLVTRPELSSYLRRFFEVTQPSRLSMAAIETLAIVAYNQNITAPEIQALRGINSTGVLKTLLERRLVRITGRRQVVGRPFEYGTSREFLLHFGLASLGDLPPLEEFEQLVTADLERMIEEELGTAEPEHHLVAEPPERATGEATTASRAPEATDTPDLLPTPDATELEPGSAAGEPAAGPPAVTLATVESGTEVAFEEPDDVFEESANALDTEADAAPAAGDELAVETYAPVVESEPAPEAPESGALELDTPEADATPPAPEPVRASDEASALDAGPSGSPLEPPIADPGPPLADPESLAAESISLPADGGPIEDDPEVGVVADRSESDVETSNATPEHDAAASDEPLAIEEPPSQPPVPPTQPEPDSSPNGMPNEGVDTAVQPAAGDLGGTTSAEIEPPPPRLETTDEDTLPLSSPSLELDPGGEEEQDGWPEPVESKPVPVPEPVPEPETEPEPLPVPEPELAATATTESLPPDPVAPSQPTDHASGGDDESAVSPRWWQSWWRLVKEKTRALLGVFGRLRG